MSAPGKEGPGKAERPLALAGTLRPRLGRLKPVESQLQPTRCHDVLERGCVLRHVTPAA